MKDHDQASLEEVLKLIESEPAIWLRVAEIRYNDAWRLALFDMVGGAEPHNWLEQRWEYDDAHFTSVKASGEEVFQWLRGGEPVIGGLKAELPQMHDPVPIERHQSRHNQVTYEPLRWPVTQYSLNVPDMQSGSGVSPLVGDLAPSFFQFQAAAASFFRVVLTGRNMESAAWMFRRQETAGRITRVRLKPTGVDVSLEGHDLANMTVELASDVPGVSQPVSPARVESEGDLLSAWVEFPGALQRNAWVLLKRGRRWVDRRFLNWGYRTAADEGIEEVFEPQQQLEALVSMGEGPTVEFKEELPPPQAKPGQLKFLNGVAAFANGDGGTVLFGVADDGEVVGLNRDDVDGGTKDRLTNLVQAHVTPLPAYSVELYDVEGKPDRVVLAVRVEVGLEPPYGVKPGNPSYYLRRGATNVPASSQAVRYLARSRPPVAQRTRPPWA